MTNELSTIHQYLHYLILLREPCSVEGLQDILQSEVPFDCYSEIMPVYSYEDMLCVRVRIYSTLRGKPFELPLARDEAYALKQPTLLTSEMEIQ